MSLAIKLQEKYNYNDYLSWDDNEQWELINGKAYCMSPAPSTEHQRILTRLANKIYNYLISRPCEMFIAPFDVRFPEGDQSDEEIETVVQPDIVVICDESKIDERGAKGAPDFIIEITSPATVNKDVKEKFNLYEKHGVKEYWIVYPGENSVIVYRLSPEAKYKEAKIFTSSDTVKVEAIKGLKIDLREVFGKKEKRGSVKPPPKKENA